MNFRVGTIRDYDGTFPYYNLPVDIGHFSTDSENRFFDDNHQMKYLSLPDKLIGLQMDLSEGYSQYVGIYNDEENSYNKLLRWIISHKEAVKKYCINVDSSKTKIGFICYRSVLLSVSTILYEKNEDCMIYATKFKSNIYLCKIDTEQKLEREKRIADKERLWSSWGYKFEQYITSDTVGSKPNTTLPVNVNEKFFVVMKGKLENHDIMFTGETDAVDPKYLFGARNDPKSMKRFVEMKTAKILNGGRLGYYFRLKLLKWYLQSFIAGIPRLICGFRDNNGIVREIKEYNTDDIPKMAGDVWSPAVCLNFCSHFLSFIKQSVVKDDPKVVYKFYWKPGNAEITCEELSFGHQFLPEWYTTVI